MFLYLYNCISHKITKGGWQQLAHCEKGHLKNMPIISGTLYLRYRMFKIRWDMLILVEDLLQFSDLHL